ncbi:MAG: hypothetical protein RL227_1311 [Pseudomonadota bacterium]|jgi:uncharacterized membrane protein YbaN (DUF454 family)
MNVLRSEADLTMTTLAPSRAMDAPGTGEPGTLRRRLWLTAGVLWLMLGTIGIAVPLLPTVDCYGLAAFCFARGSRRWEAWLLAHPRLGPSIVAWRRSRAVPLSAKITATLSMGVSCGLAAWWLNGVAAWLPLAFCLPVAAYLWSRPSIEPALPCKP